MPPSLPPSSKNCRAVSPTVTVCGVAVMKTSAGLATSTGVAAVKGAMPPGWATVATFVISTCTLAPTAAVPRKSPFTVKVVVPGEGASLRVKT